MLLQVLGSLSCVADSNELKWIWQKAGLWSVLVELCCTPQNDKADTRHNTAIAH